MNDYAQRKRAGKVALMVWVDADVGEELGDLVRVLGQSKTRVVEDAIMRLAEATRRKRGRAPSKADASSVKAALGVARQRSANGLICTVCETPQFNTPGGPSCANGHGGADGHPPDPAPEAPPPARARQHVPAGSSDEMATRVRAGGVRRSATIVATGERAADGVIKR